MDALKTTITKKDNYNSTEMHVMIVNENEKIFRIEHYTRLSPGRNLFESKGYKNFADLESVEINFFSSNFSGYHSLTEQREKIQSQES